MTRPGPGKFQNNESLEIAEALYSMLGEENDSYGDSSSGLGWYGLFTDIDVLVDGVSSPYPEGMQANYIVEEDTNGFFTYEGFDSVDATKEKFAKMKQAQEDEDFTVDHGISYRGY